MLNGDFVDGVAFYAKVLIRLEHLQNMFFLERLLAEDRGPGRRTLDLLSVSVDMVSLTLIFWTHKNRFPSMSRHLDWLVMSYAAPAGGVLCLELMEPTPMDPMMAGDARPTDERLSRSSLIQNLSLLVGFLGWVAPRAPNGDMCRSVKGIIQRVLDVTLNNRAGIPASARRSKDLEWDGLNADMNHVFFNFELMDTFGWLRPEMGYEGA